MKRQFLVGALLLVLAIGVFLLFRSFDRNELFTVMEVPSFELTNQNNEIITEQTMNDKVYLVEFFFTNCPTICPIMKENLIEIEKAINHPDFGIISITIDPKRDTPETLKIQQEKLGIQNANWHFLTGDRAYIYELSKKFNIYIGDDVSSAEGLNHSGKFALVDKKGKIRSRYDAKGFPILYYSGLNYSDPGGKNESLGGEFHPQVNWLKEDIKKLVNE